MSIDSTERGKRLALPTEHGRTQHPPASLVGRSMAPLPASSVRAVLSLLLLLSVSACRDASLDGATSGLFRPLAEISDVEAGMPVLVFVYTDG